MFELLTENNISFPDGFLWGTGTAGHQIEGNNIHSQISNMFGNEYTVFGRAVQNYVNAELYTYSLSSNLASVMETMTLQVTSLGLESSFRTEQSHATVTESHLTNHSALALDHGTVNASLKAFTEATDIPVVIVVDTMENVFGKSIALADVLVVLFMIALIAFIIYFIYKTIRSRKNGPQGGNNNSGNNGYNNGYNNGNYNNNGYNSY